MRKKLITLVIWCALLLTFLVFLNLRNEEHLPSRSLADFKSDLDSNQVEEVWYKTGHRFVVQLSDPEHSRYDVSANLAEEELLNSLYEHDVVINWQQRTNNFWSGLLSTLLPLLLVIVVFFLLLRRMAGQGGKNILELRKSNARTLADTAKITFNDIGGCAEAKQLVGDVITFLKDPTAWKNAGVRLPRGILLQGPPGCGKSLLARAVAGETNAKFLYISASEFCELFIGVGAARVRDLFEQARKESPCVIFIDEIDSVGRRRGSGMSSLTNDEREQTLNQLLVCMDGLENAERVVVIAATNRPDILDRALLRTGRFDRIIQIPPLTREERKSVLEIHTREKKLESASLLDEVASRTEGNTGSELETLCNEAGIFAVRRHLTQTDGGIPQIRLCDFEQALEHLKSRSSKFSQLDLLLIESSSQLSEPVVNAAAVVTLDDGTTVAGDILWADVNYLKLSARDNGGAKLVAKKQIKSIELSGETHFVST